MSSDITRDTSHTLDLSQNRSHHTTATSLVVCSIVVFEAEDRTSGVSERTRRSGVRRDDMSRLRCGRAVLLSMLTVAWLALCGPGAAVSTARAQMITSGTGLHSVSSRFYERHGVSFGFGFGGSGRVRTVGGFGSPLGLPPFGGLGGWMNGGLRSGWSVRSGSVTGHFGFYAYQGSQRSLVSSQAVVTGLPGYPMLITDGLYMPFVVGIVPVGPYGAYMVAPLGGFYGLPAAVGRIPYRSWRDPWWIDSSGWNGLDRSYPVGPRRETLGDRYRAARRRAAASTPPPRRSPPRPSTASVRDLSSAAFRQLGGRSSRR